MNEMAKHEEKYAIIKYIDGDLKGKLVLYTQSELNDLRLMGNIGSFEQIIAENLTFDEAENLLR